MNQPVAKGFVLMFVCATSLRQSTAIVLVVVLAMFNARANGQDGVQRNDRAVLEYNGASDLQNLGLYEPAAKRWREFLSKYPDDELADKAAYYLGICQLHRQEFAEAAKTFETILKEYPHFEVADGARFNRAMAHYRLAESSSRTEDYGKAAAAFGDLLEKHPASEHAAKALFFQGESLYAANRLEAALLPLKQLINQQPKSELVADAHYALGTAQQDLADDAGAVATFQSFLQREQAAKHPLNDEIRLRMALSLFNLKQFESAEAEFRRVAAAQEFQHADFALLRQAQCLAQIDRLADAASAYASLMKLHPNSDYATTARLAAGKCYFQFGDYDNARQHLVPAARGEDDVAAEATYWLGRTLLKQGEAQTAARLLEASRSVFVDTEWSPHLELAYADALFEDPQTLVQSHELYTDFIRRFPRHEQTPHALYMVALSALRCEDYASAATAAEQFLHDSLLANHQLRAEVLFLGAESQLLSAQENGAGDLGQAESYYRSLVEEFPQHPRTPLAKVRIGWTLFETKRFDEGIAHLSAIVGEVDAAQLKAEAYLLLGLSLHAQGRDAEAVDAYELASNSRPQWQRGDEILIAAARSLRALGKGGEARRRLDELNQAFPQSTYRDEALYQLGELSLAEKQFRAAIDHFTSVLKQQPSRELAHAARYSLAASHFNLGDFETASASLTELFSQDPAPELRNSALLLRGLAQQQEGQYEKAEIDLAEFLRSDPSASERAEAEFALAKCRSGLEDYPAAAVMLRALIDGAADHEHLDQFHYELAHALAASGDSIAASEVFHTLAEEFPDSRHAAEAWFHVGQRLESQAESAQEAETKAGMLAQAADCYSSGLAMAELGELGEKLLYKLGDVYFRNGQYEVGAKTLRQQIGEYPNGELAGPARFLTAECLFRQDQFELALPLYQTVIQSEAPRYRAQSLYRAGGIAAKLRDWTSSEEHFKNLIKQFPEFELLDDARYGVALAYQKQNRLDDAEALCREVAESSTETGAKAQFMLGEIAFARGQYEAAVSEYVVAANYPYVEIQALARLEAGRCLMELDKPQQAAAMLKLVVDEHGDSPLAEDAKKLINALNN